MNPCSRDICTILAAAGLGLTFATNLFSGQEPATPANTVTVFDTPGDAPGKTMEGAQGYYYPAVQVRVRNTSYANGYALAFNIQAALHMVGHQTWNGTRYEVIQSDQDPFHLDYDESNRPRFVCNFSIQRKSL